MWSRMSDSSPPATRLALTAALAAGAGVAAGWYLRAEYPSLVSSAFAAKAGKKKKKKKSRSTVAPANAAPASSVAATGAGSGGGPAMYETRRAVDEYVQFHLGDPKDVLPYGEGAPHQALRFTQRCADLCAKHCRSAPAPRRTVGGGGSSDDLLLMPFESGATSRVRQGVALDVGCAVGGASFELTRHFRDVVGVDLSASFVAAAKVLKERGRLTYKSLAEGETYVTKEARVNPKIDRTRVEFREGDACALPPSLLGGGGDFADAENFQNFGRHDAVLAANLLCRLPDPEAFLRDCARLVRPDGVLVLVSPYSWLEAWTPKHKWLGGAAAPGKNGKTNRSFEAIRALLESAAGGFDLVDQSDLPFLIKEHDRKFQWGCSHATVWRRRKRNAEAR